MKIFSTTKDISSEFLHSTLAIGNFDGVHLGHQFLLNRALSHAKSTNTPACVMSFEPHPHSVLLNKTNFRLTTPGQKRTLFEKLGFDAYIELAFQDTLPLMSGTEFIEQILISDLKVKTILIGPNFMFGAHKSGNIPLLKEYEQKGAFKLIIPDLQTNAQGEIISSSFIRKILREGALEQIPSLTGRPWSILGSTTPGAQRGGGLGFPTLNFKKTETLIPKLGVYAGYCLINAKQIKAVINIGPAPTFNRKEIIIEAHLLDNLSLPYDTEVEVFLTHYIRDQLAFNSPEDLKDQIKKDIETAKIFTL